MKWRSMSTVRLFGVGVIVALLAACVPQSGTKTNVSSGSGGPTMAEAQGEAYNGPKARIAVARFKDKTHGNWWNKEIGDGMADMLTTALFNTNRYIVLERSAAFEDVLEEQDLGASGRVRSDTAAPTGELEGAELLVVGAVTEFEGNAAGTRGGGGGAGGGILGAVFGGVKKSHIAIDLRVVDTQTGRIVAANSVEGEASDFNVGGVLAGFTGSAALGGGLEVYKNTPVEKALRAVIGKSVQFMVDNTPQRYYHVGGNQQQTGTATASGSAGASSASTSGGGAGSTGERVVVTASSLNVRAGPGTSNAAIFSVEAGTAGDVLTRENGWIKIRTQDGREGWVSGEYTAPLQ